MVNPEGSKAAFPCWSPLADAGAAPGMQEVMAGSRARSWGCTQPPLRFCGVSRGVTTGWGHGQRTEVGLAKCCCHPPWELEGNPSLGKPLRCCPCGFVPLGKGTAVCSMSLARISRNKAMALGRTAGRGRGALLGLGGDDKRPHPSPCCPVSVGMLLDCDISQSLLASCGSRLIVLLPQAAPLCPLLLQLFAPAAHPSHLKQPCGKDISCSAPGTAALFYPLDLGRVFEGGWGHGDMAGDTGTSLGTSLLPSASSSPQGQNPPALHSQRSNRV